MNNRLFLFLFFLSHSAFGEETTFLLIRHGVTDWNLENRYQGHSNIPLNAEGFEQARHLADVLVHKNLSAVYASDLDRAVMTAQETAQRLQLPVTANPDFREIFWGEAEGITGAEKKAKYDAAFQQWKAQSPDWRERWKTTYIPDSETQEHLIARVKNALLAIAPQHAGQTVAVFMHGRAIYVLDCDILNREDAVYPDHGQIVSIAIDPETQKIRFLGVEDTR